MMLDRSRRGGPGTADAFVFMLLILSLLTIAVSASTAATGWRNLISSTDSQGIDEISSLLYARAEYDTHSLSNAKRIIHDLSSSSTCAHAATARLLRHCKLIKPQKDIAESELQKENAQTSYAVSMALCEARQARIQSPRACHIFEGLHERAMPDGSIEIVRQEEIERCANELYNTPTWTSLNVYKAQSKDLCDASRIDYQREELLDHFRKATRVIPEILDALRDQQFETYGLMTNIRESASGILAWHEHASTLVEQQARQSQDYLQQFTAFVSLHMLRLNESEAHFKSAIGESLHQVLQDLALVSDRTTAVGSNLAEIYAAAADAVSGMSIEMNSVVEAMATEVNSLVDHMIELSTAGHMQVIEKTMALGQQAAAEYARIQAAQVEDAQAQLSLSQQVLRTIEHSRGRLDEIQQAVDLLPTSWFEVLQHFQAHAARLRLEIKCALVAFVPSVLLLLCGRLRAATALMLGYVFIRTICSFLESFSAATANLGILQADVKAAGLYVILTTSVVGSIALACNCFGLWSPQRRPHRSLDEAPFLRMAHVNKRGRKVVPPAASLWGHTKKSALSRSERAKSVPIDMA